MFGTGEVEREQDKILVFLSLCTSLSCFFWRVVVVPMMVCTVRTGRFHLDKVREIQQSTKKVTTILVLLGRIFEWSHSAHRRDQHPTVVPSSLWFSCGGILVDSCCRVCCLTITWNHAVSWRRLPDPAPLLESSIRPACFPPVRVHLFVRAKYGGMLCFTFSETFNNCAFVSIFFNLVLVSRRFSVHTYRIRKSEPRWLWMVLGVRRRKKGCKAQVQRKRKKRRRKKMRRP